MICISYEADKETMDFIAWKNEMLLLAVPSVRSINHHLFESRLTFSDVKVQKHLLLNYPKVTICNFKNESFLTLPKGNDIYKRTMDICHQSGFTPTISMAPDQQLTAYHLTKANMGITFIREQLISYLGETNDIFFYCIDSPLAQREICIAYKKNRILPIAVSEFYEFLQHQK
jgi:DNA-binding transcriptional LysR family regulator